jgi:hypothetical protein
VIKVADTLTARKIFVNALDENKVVVDSSVLHVRNLPNPDIYLGGTLNGSKLTGDYSRFIFVKYHPGIPLTATFAVKKWIVSFGDEKVEGIGSSLSSKALELIKRIEPDGMFSIIVTVMGPDGKTRELGASFRV